MGRVSGVVDGVVNGVRHDLNVINAAVGRLSEVTTTIAGSPQTLAGAVTWRADGRLTGRSFGNGLRETRTYDTRGQLRTQQLGTEVTTYAYDPAGNLLSRSWPGADHAWDYDALDRVTGDRLDARARSYAYDANHNRRDALIEGLPEAYGYAPASNRLTALATPATSQVLTQDAAGNLTDDGAGQTYAYNQAGRLASAETAAGITGYRYSALGLRTHKAGATTTVFHHDAAGRLLAETTADGTPIRSYVWFGDEPLAQLDGPLGSETPTYLHTDHLATPRLGTDPAGIPVWRWESPAFGDAPPSLQLRTVNLRFPGQYYDAETGLHQNWHRDYDPRIGRYVQSDPVGLAGGSNSYGYVQQNPNRHTDPTGQLIPAVAAGVAGACARNPACVRAVAATAQAAVDAVAVGVVMFNDDGSDSTDLPDNDDTVPEQCSDDDEDDNCEALYQSTLRTCASLTGRKRFACFEAARINREQCYQERGK